MRGLFTPNAMQVQRLFEKEIEFASQNEMLPYLGNMSRVELDAALDELLASGKVIVDSDGYFVWICIENNEGLKRLLRESVPI